MKIDLHKDELEYIKRALNNSDPFTTVKEAESRVYRTKQSIEDLQKQLILDEKRLKELQQRDSLVLKLKEKLK